MNKQEAILKLNKLRGHLERNCATESDNARRIADRLIKEYNITPAEFSYFWHADVNAQAQKKAQENKEAQARKDFADIISRMHKATNAKQERERKAREEAEATERRERREREAREFSERLHASRAQKEQAQSASYYRVSYTSNMRGILLHLIRSMHLDINISGAKIEIKVSSERKKEFDIRWNKVKAVFKKSMSDVLKEMSERITLDTI